MKKLIQAEYFKLWKSMLDMDIKAEFSAIQSEELKPHSFTFYTSISVMSSSKIEGEQMELDSYVKHKMLNIEYLPELTEKPNDLYKAYLFAKENKLRHSNFLQAHKLITAHLLPEARQGALRQTEMLVMEHKTGEIQYEAAPFSTGTCITQATVARNSQPFRGRVICGGNFLLRWIYSPGICKYSPFL